KRIMQRLIDIKWIPSNKEGVARLSILSIILLILLKVMGSNFTGSIGLRADAVHSSIDLFGAFISLICIRISAMPNDFNHTFGHGKADYIAGLFIAVLIFLAAGTITYEAIKRILSGGALELVTTGIYITAIAILINLSVSLYTLKVAKSKESMALEATGYDLLADSYSSVAVLIGLILIKLTGIFLLDPIVALLVAILITKTAFSTFKKSINGLMDARLPVIEENFIRDCIMKYYPKIVEFRNLRTRKAGTERYVDFQLVVPRDYSIEKAHSICDKIEQNIEESLGSANISIHLEPCMTQCVQCNVACNSQLN
ncbi:cation diffusion facilitator family transporter, partial [Thermodesulfobacteriota bacterium]